MKSDTLIWILLFFPNFRRVSSTAKSIRIRIRLESDLTLENFRNYIVLLFLIDARFQLEDHITWEWLLPFYTFLNKKKGLLSEKLSMIFLWFCSMLSSLRIRVTKKSRIRIRITSFLEGLQYQIPLCKTLFWVEFVKNNRNPFGIQTTFDGERIFSPIIEKRGIEYSCPSSP